MTEQTIRRSFRMGLVHFMAYPFAASGEGDIEGTVRRVLADPFFELIELTHIQDATVRRRVGDLARQAGVDVAYGAQPQLMRNGENLCSLDEPLRLRGVERMKRCIDEACELGAKGIAFLAGPFDPAREEVHYDALCRSARAICEDAAAKGLPSVTLEVFDRDVEKRSLIGPVGIASRFGREMHEAYPFFGLMADMSHILQLRETFAQSLTPIAPYLRHAHIANAVLTPGMPAYGDQHPRFGIAGSEADAATLADYLRTLRDIGYLNPDNPPPLSFEVKPWGDEDSDMVVAGSKRVLAQALSLMAQDEANG